MKLALKLSITSAATVAAWDFNQNCFPKLPSFGDALQQKDNPISDLDKIKAINDPAQYRINRVILCVKDQQVQALRVFLINDPLKPSTAQTELPLYTIGGVASCTNQQTLNVKKGSAVSLIKLMYGGKGRGINGILFRVGNDYYPFGDLSGEEMTYQFTTEKVFLGFSGVTQNGHIGNISPVMFYKNENLCVPEPVVKLPMPVVSVEEEKQPDQKLIAALISVAATVGVIYALYSMIGCTATSILYYIKTRPRKRLPGETTEVELLRFDQDLELQSYRGLLSEVQEDIEQQEYLLERKLITEELVQKMVEQVLAVIVVKEKQKRDQLIQILIGALVKNAADIGQENLDEKERERIRLETIAEQARIQAIFEAFEQERVKALKEFEEYQKEEQLEALRKRILEENILLEQNRQEEAQRQAQLKALEGARFAAEVQALREAEILRQQLDASMDLIKITASYKVNMDADCKEIRRKAGSALSKLRDQRLQEAYGKNSEQQDQTSSHAFSNSQASPRHRMSPQSQDRQPDSANELSPTRLKLDAVPEQDQDEKLEDQMQTIQQMQYRVASEQGSPRSPEINVPGTWYFNKSNSMRQNQQRIQKLKNANTNSLIMSSRTERYAIQGETTRSQEPVSGSFRSAFQPEVVWTSPIENQMMKLPCPAPIATVKDRIRVQKEIYKQRHGSNLRGQFYNTNTNLNSDLSDAEGSDVPEQLQYKNSQRERQNTAELPGLRHTRYERSRFQKGRSSEMMRFAGEHVIQKCPQSDATSNDMQNTAVSTDFRATKNNIPQSRGTVHTVSSIGEFVKHTSKQNKEFD